MRRGDETSESTPFAPEPERFSFRNLLRRPVRLGWAAGFSIAMVSAGGGTVLFPSGEWMSGKIPMKSNLTLEITSDAALLDAPGPIYGAPDGLLNALIWGDGLFFPCMAVRWMTPPREITSIDFQLPSRTLCQLQMKAQSEGDK